MRRHRAVATTVMLLAALPAPAVAEEEPGRVREFRLQDPALTESSGLVVTGPRVLTVNDSGGGPVVHVLDPATGRTVGRTTYSSSGVVDVEALAPARDGGVWVADIGDNRRARPVISLYRLPPPGDGPRTVAAARYDLVYPDRPRDAETLLADPATGRLFVVSKGLLGGEVFAAPERLVPGQRHRLRRVAAVDGMVTDGTFLSADTVVLRTYSEAVVLDPATWEERGRFALPPQPQGEAIAPWRADRVLVTSEGRRQPAWSVPVPAALLASSAPAPSAPAPSPSRDPFTEDTDEEPAGDGLDAEVPRGPLGVAGAVLVLAGAAGVAATARAALRSRRDRQSRSTT